MFRSRLFRRVVFACALLGALVGMPLLATAADPIVEITAWGNGHGVGMSQNGAGGMAERGLGYADILKSYYTGITVAPDKVLNRSIDVAITDSTSRQSWTVLAAEGTLTFAYSGGSRDLPAGRYTITAGPYSNVRVVNTATGVEEIFPITSAAGLEVWGSNSVPRDGDGLSAVALVEATRFREFWSMTSNQFPAFDGKLVFRPVINAPTQLTCVNRLSMNDYLMGVEPFEMGPSFPLEARRAQAVAARSYIVQRAYGSTQAASHSLSPVGFTDVVQVYKGFGIYYADTKTLWQYNLRKGTSGSGHVYNVVAGINDQVAAYNGLAINAMFSASHGGKSENSENVFVSRLPYLKGVSEPYPARIGSSVPTRTLRFTGDQILTALRAQWPDSAPPAGTRITGLEISKLGYSRPIELKALHPGYGTGASYYSGSGMYSFYRKLGFNSSYSTIKPLVPVYKATRIWGPIAIDTSVEISKAGFPGGGVGSVVLAAGPLDALAASGLAGVLNGGSGAPVILTSKDVLSPQAASEIGRLGAGKVIIVGGPVAVSTAVEQSVKSLGKDVVRLGGATFVDTANLINTEMRRQADAAGITIDRAIVVGEKGLDAVAAAPIAYAQHWPIVPVGVDVIPAPSAATLADPRINRTLVVGGTVVVSDATLSRLRLPVRVWGGDVYDTSAALARYQRDMGMTDASSVYYARGGVSMSDMVDGLSGGPLAGKSRSPIVLVSSPVPHFSTEAIARDFSAYTKSAFILGGPAAVSLQNEAVISRYLP